MTCRIEVTTYFEKQAKRLKKKHPHVGDDIRILVKELSSNQKAGERISDTHPPVYKIRMRSRDMQRGKRGGFRILYLIRRETLYLMFIYSKSELSDVKLAKLRMILQAFNEEFPD